MNLKLISAYTIITPPDAETGIPQWSEHRKTLRVHMKRATAAWGSDGHFVFRTCRLAEEGFIESQVDYYKGVAA